MNEKQYQNNYGLSVAIGSLSSVLNIHQRTLRIYDKEGILVPKRKNGRRYYSFEDFEKAKFILFLTRNLAINLSGVKIILLLLEENKIKPVQYVDFINNIAKSVKIDVKIQEKNIKKALKKGRPKLKNNAD